MSGRSGLDDEQINSRGTEGDGYEEATQEESTEGQNDSVSGQEKSGQKKRKILGLVLYAGLATAAAVSAVSLFGGKKQDAVQQGAEPVLQQVPQVVQAPQGMPQYPQPNQPAQSAQQEQALPAVQETPHKMSKEAQEELEKLQASNKETQEKLGWLEGEIKEIKKAIEELKKKQAKPAVAQSVPKPADSTAREDSVKKVGKASPVKAETKPMFRPDYSIYAIRDGRAWVKNGADADSPIFNVGEGVSLPDGSIVKKIDEDAGVVSTTAGDIR